MSKFYIVKYSLYDYEKDIFVTDKKSKATKYVTKFNKILSDWKIYYNQYCEKGIYGFEWIKEEYEEKYYERWSSLHNINKCYWEEIEKR